MILLSIPKPCKEKWDNMTPDENGRFCLSCSKNVIDFSEMTNAEIVEYFLNNQDKEVCGRYRNSQLNTPLLTVSEEVFISRAPLWQKFLAILLIVFSINLFGCKSELRPIDKISDVPVQTIPITKTGSAPQLVVEPESPELPPISKAKKKNKKSSATEEVVVFTYGFVNPYWTNFTPSLLPDKLRPANTTPVSNH
jgi:hypothetical protein